VIIVGALTAGCGNNVNQGPPATINSTTATTSPSSSAAPLPAPTENRSVPPTANVPA
jgi:hypothetical protein